jgi:hypothetical protein
VEHVETAEEAFGRRTAQPAPDLTPVVREREQTDADIDAETF